MSAYDLNAEVIWQRKRIAELEAEVQALTEKEPGFAAVMLRLAAAESRVAELQTENERLRDEDSDFQREQEAENESLRATQDRLVADLLAAESREKELLADLARKDAALNAVQDELGVPDASYPAPVANAYMIAGAALEGKP